MTVSVQRSMSPVSCTRHDFLFRLLPIVPDEPFHVMFPFPEIASGNRNRWCALSNGELNGIRWHPSAVWASRSARGVFPWGPHWCYDTSTERYTAVTLIHGVFPCGPHWSHDTSTERYTAVTLIHGVFPCGPHWCYTTSTERYTTVTLTHGVFPYRPHWSHYTSTECYTTVTLTHVLTVQCRRGSANTHRYSAGVGEWAHDDVDDNGLWPIFRWKHGLFTLVSGC